MPSRSGSRASHHSHHSTGDQEEGRSSARSHGHSARSHGHSARSHGHSARSNHSHRSHQSHRSAAPSKRSSIVPDDNIDNNNETNHKVTAEDTAVVPQVAG